MDEHNVIGEIGSFLDKIQDRKTIKSKHWKCSKCKEIYNFNEPVTIPAPCECGSIFFETKGTK